MKKLCNIVTYSCYCRSYGIWPSDDTLLIVSFWWEVSFGPLHLFKILT